MPLSDGGLGFIASMFGGALNTVNQINQPQRQYRWNKRAMEDANALNRANQQWLLEQQKGLRDEARLYDSPEAQMARLKAAGLNPHLIYGSGSSAGGAFPIDAGQIAPARLDAPQAAMPDPVGNFLAASRGFAGLELTGAKTAESLMRAQSNEIQIEIAKTNPMLSPEVAKAVSKAMENAAELKSAQDWYIKNSWIDQGDRTSRIYVAKINNEVEALWQKLQLNTQDLAIKNKILESKEFENAIKEIQTRWLKDGDITPEHIRQGLMLILTKMLGR